MKKISLILLLAILAMPFSMKADYNVSKSATWKTIKIVLDPGHGGSDPGASGPSAPHEATLCLAAAKQVRTWLYALGASSSNVKMTRTTDVFISLSARKNYTSTYNSDIFCSFHLNAFNGTAKGTETYYTNKSGATSSSKLASRVQSQLISKLGLTNRGVKTANYTVIANGVTYPSILTEGLFVDNRSEWNIIKDYKIPSAGFLKWAKSHIIGFYNYLKNDKGCTNFTDPTTVTDSTTGGSTDSGSTDTGGTGDTSTAAITTSVSGSTTMSGKMGEAPTASFKITVKGSKLTTNISVNPSNSAVVVTKDSGWNDLTGGTLTVKPNHNYSQGAGTYEGFVAIQSTSSHRKEIAYKVTLAEADGSEANPDGGSTGGGSSSTQGGITLSTSGSTELVGTVADANPAYFDIKVSATGITGDGMTVATSSSSVTVATQSDWNAMTGGTVRVALNPKYVLGPGEYEGYVAVQQGADHRNTITYTVVLTEAGGFVADLQSVEMSAVEVGDEHPGTASVSYTGVGLANDIAVSISGEGFALNNTSADGTANLVQSLTLPKTGGAVEIMFTPTAAGEFTTNLVATSGDKTITIPVSITVYASGQTPVLNDDVTALTGVWEYSQTKGNVASAPWMAITGLRTTDMVKMGDNLYVVNAYPWQGDPVINVVNAYNPSTVKTLSLEGIGTANAEVHAASLAVLDGKLIMSNAARTTQAGDKLRVYRWKDDNSKPELMFEVDPKVNSGYNMAVTGDWSDGRIWFFSGYVENDASDGMTAVYYHISGGYDNLVVDAPVTVKLPAAIHGYNRSTAEVIPYDDGSFWVDGNNAVPTLYNADGTQRYQIASTAIGTKGTASKIVTFGSKTYMVSTDYLDGITKGVAAVIDITDGPDKAVRKCVYPEAGLGTTKTDSYTNTILTEVVENADNSVLNIWVLIQNQGIAHAQFKGEYAVSGVEDVEIEGAVDENAPVEFYNLNGVQVDGENLVPGIYIRRQGNTVSKVLVR